MRTIRRCRRMGLWCLLGLLLLATTAGGRWWYFHPAVQRGAKHGWLTLPLDLRAFADWFDKHLR